jgi:ASF1 like histone chaperone
MQTVHVGPITAGVNRFVLHTPAPAAALIPPLELIGMTVVLLSCSYNNKEFIRIGYYVSTWHTVITIAEWAACLTYVHYHNTSTP